MLPRTVGTLAADASSRAVGVTADRLAAIAVLDAERDGLEARIREIAAIVEEPAEVGDLRQAVEAIEARQRSADADRLDADLSVEGLTAKIHQEQERLYSGRIKNPRELTDLSNEIDALRRQLASLQETDLGAIEMAEATAAELESARASFKQAERTWRLARKAAAEEYKLARGRLEELNTLTGSAREGLAAPALALYDRVRARQPRAVARVEGRLCTGCRTQLPETDLKQARAGDTLVQCSSCRRILQV